MESIRRFIVGRRVYFFAFLLSCLAMGSAFLIFGIFPIGEKSVLTVDLSQQYVQIFSEFRNIILSGDSLFYSWNAGMGLNWLGIFSYYLANPFNLIIFLFPESLIVEAITLIIILKAGISGVTFTFFARNVLNANALTGLAFSLFYSMSAWAVVFYSNLMWHDALMILPLVIYSIDRLINHGKLFGLIVSLFYIFVTQYYMSYMVGIFAFIAFICFCFFLPKNGRFKAIFVNLGKFALCTVLALGMAAIILVPTIFVMGDSMGLLGQSLPKWELCFSLAEMPQMLFNGAFSGMLANKLPNIYSGVITIILIPVYFFNSRISKRERAVIGGLVGFMFLTMVLMPTNIMWQFFDEPNGFYGRYTFLISFILVSMACRGFMFLDGIKLKTPIIAGCCILIYLLVSYFLLPDNVIDTKSLCVNIALIIVSCAFLILSFLHFEKAKFFHYLFILLALTDVVLNASATFINIDATEGIANRNSYVNFAANMRNATKSIEEIDNDFYRIEKDFNQNFNDSMAGHYRGVAHYSSATNINLNKTLANLGYQTQNDYNMWVSNKGATLVTNSLFGVRYVMSKDTDKPGYGRFFYTGNNVQVQHNAYALPLAYHVDSSVKDLSLVSEDPFENQTDLVSTMCGKDIALYSDTPFFHNAKNANLFIDENGTYNLVPIDDSEPSSIYFTAIATKSDLLYASFFSDERFPAEIVYNGEPLVNCFDYDRAFPYSLGIQDIGQYSEIKITFSEKVSFKPRFTYLSENAVADFTNTLKTTNVSIDSFSDTNVEMSTYNENSNLLFTSIPYDKGWSITVNGVPQEPIAVLDGAFIGLELSAGQNYISMTFMPVGFRAGVIISCVSVVLTFILYFYTKGLIRRPKRKMNIF